MIRLIVILLWLSFVALAGAEDNTHLSQGSHENDFRPRDKVLLSTAPDIVEYKRNPKKTSDTQNNELPFPLSRWLRQRESYEQGEGRRSISSSPLCGDADVVDDLVRGGGGFHGEENTKRRILHSHHSVYENCFDSSTPEGRRGGDGRHPHTIIDEGALPSPRMRHKKTDKRARTKKRGGTTTAKQPTVLEFNTKRTKQMKQRKGKRDDPLVVETENAVVNTPSGPSGGADSNANTNTPSLKPSNVPSSGSAPNGGTSSSSPPKKEAPSNANANENKNKNKNKHNNNDKKNNNNKHKEKNNEKNKEKHRESNKKNKPGGGGTGSNTPPKKIKPSLFPTSAPTHSLDTLAPSRVASLRPSPSPIISRLSSPPPNPSGIGVQSSSPTLKPSILSSFSNSETNTNTTSFSPSSMPTVKVVDKVSKKRTGGEYVDVFAATGQSNAYWPPIRDNWAEDIDNSGSHDFGRGVKEVIVKSQRFSNPVVVINGSPGRRIQFWYDEFRYGGGPNMMYEQQFFGNYMDQGEIGDMEVLYEKIRKDGNIPRFRGLFWFQGESDGEGPGQENTPTDTYILRWNGFIAQLEKDVGTKDFGFVVNTVGNSGDRINNTLKKIAKDDDRGAVFNTQVPPYRTDTKDIHGYDHFAVGRANAQLFLDTFKFDR